MFFPVTCILLLVAGIGGLIMDLIFLLGKAKDADCPKFLMILILLMGLAWSVAALLASYSGYTEAKRIILQQRRKKNTNRKMKTRLNRSQLGMRAVLIIALCGMQIIVAMLTGLKVWQLLVLFIIGIIIPYLFMISGRANSA